MSSNVPPGNPSKLLLHDSHMNVTIPRHLIDIYAVEKGSNSKTYEKLQKSHHRQSLNNFALDHLL